MTICYLECLELHAYDVVGEAEKLVGHAVGNPTMVARGQEKKVRDILCSWSTEGLIRVLTDRYARHCAEYRKRRHDQRCFRPRGRRWARSLNGILNKL